MYDAREKRFSRVKELLDLRRAPVGIAAGKTLPLSTLNEWRRRGITCTRANIDRILRDAACTVREELLERLPYIRAALEWRIDRIVNIVEWS